MKKKITTEELIKMLETEKKEIIRLALKDYGKNDDVGVKNLKEMEDFLWNLELYESEHYAYDSGALGEINSILNYLERSKK